jgi:hypothetical protein
MVSTESVRKHSVCHARCHVRNDLLPDRHRKKNWLFAGADTSAGTLARTMAIIETAKLNGLDPQAYFADILDRIHDQKINRLEDLLLRNWMLIAMGNRQAAQAPISMARLNSNVCVLRKRQRKGFWNGGSGYQNLTCRLRKEGGLNERFGRHQAATGPESPSSISEICRLGRHSRHLPQ